MKLSEVRIKEMEDEAPYQTWIEQDEVIEIKLLRAIVLTAADLLNFVRNKHGVKTKDDYTCPIHRKLAGQIEEYLK